jgi:hypothetical protein
MKWLLTSLAATLLFCAPASAETLSGKTLAEGCQANTLDRVACLAYMEGFSDGFVSNDQVMTTFLKENLRSGHLTVSEKTARVEKPAYCVDDEIPADMIRKVYLDWAAAHPNGLDRPAASALFLALAEAFPCGGEPAAAASYQAVSWQP